MKVSQESVSNAFVLFTALIAMDRRARAMNMYLLVISIISLFPVDRKESNKNYLKIAELIFCIS